MGYFDDVRKPPEPEPRVNGAPIHINGNGTTYAQAALRKEAEVVAAAANGTRNATLNKAAFRMGRHVGAGNIDAGTVRTVLAEASRSTGLPEDEIQTVLRDNENSGIKQGATVPRHPAARPDVPGVTVLEDGTEVAQDPLTASWAPLDPTSILDGTYTPELPALMPRTDGANLLYPGRVHSFHGESESGKSLVAQAETVRVISLGYDVLFIDFESDQASVIGRLLELGAHRDHIRAHFTYIRPEVDPRRFPHEREALVALMANTYALAVIDGVTEALGIFGHSTKDNDDITTFMRLLPRMVARETGAAVVLVDHVTKDTEGRGRFAIGGQAKMAALDGAAFVVEVTEAIGRGLRGMVTLRVAKDRPGGVRATAGAFRKSDRTQEAARVTVDSTADDGFIHVHIEAPREGEVEFRPTHLMEKASRFIELGDEPLSQKTVTDGVGGRADTVRAALAILARDKYVKIENGPHGAILHTSLRPYREAQDPASSTYVTTLENVLVRPRPTSSHLVPDEDVLSSSQPLRSRAGAGRGQPPSDEVDLVPMDVDCKKCFRPVSETIAQVTGERCMSCFTDDGEETP